ncbi:MAG: hypothetical protein H6630_08940 [Arcobacter sp.]|nr:hypothetical protein [Arcobacter sp.]
MRNLSKLFTTTKAQKVKPSFNVEMKDSNIMNSRNLMKQQQPEDKQQELEDLMTTYYKNERNKMISKGELQPFGQAYGTTDTQTPETELNQSMLENFTKDRKQFLKDNESLRSAIQNAFSITTGSDSGKTKEPKKQQPASAQQQTPQQAPQQAPAPQTPDRPLKTREQILESVEKEVKRKSNLRGQQEPIARTPEEKAADTMPEPIEKEAEPVEAEAEVVEEAAEPIEETEIEGIPKIKNFSKVNRDQLVSYYNEFYDKAKVNYPGIELPEKLDTEIRQNKPGYQTKNNIMQELEELRRKVNNFRENRGGGGGGGGSEDL